MTKEFNLEQSNKDKNLKKIDKIIQSSPILTGSTVLLNLVYGFFLPHEQYRFSELLDEKDNIISSFFIIKSHNINIDDIMERYNDYNLYFVMSERNDEKINGLINDTYKKYNNVLVIDFKELNETSELSLNKIVENIFHKFKNFFPEPLIPKVEDEIIKKNMEERIINMNRLYEEIKHNHFGYSDYFYGIHGSHRGRS